MKLIAGATTSGNSGSGGPATSAEICCNIPWIDTAGNIYTVEGCGSTKALIRKVSPAGIITAFGGTSTGFVTSGISGPIGSTSLNIPQSMVSSLDGTILYMSDLYYVWKYTFATNIISVYAGASTLGYTGDGGSVAASKVYHPAGLWMTTANILYISDRSNHRIRKVTSSNIISTVAGSGCSGGCPALAFSGENVQATAATLSFPKSCYMNTIGKLYIADTSNFRVRVVDASGIITTFAGTGATTPFAGENIPATLANINPRDVKGDSAGNIYIADIIIM
jgi:hypothetical protein